MLPLTIVLYKEVVPLYLQVAPHRSPSRVMYVRSPLKEHRSLCIKVICKVYSLNMGHGGAEFLLPGFAFN